LDDAPLIGSPVASRKRAPAPRSADPCSTRPRATSSIRCVGDNLAWKRIRTFPSFCSWSEILAAASDGLLASIQTNAYPGTYYRWEVPAGTHIITQPQG